jgi:transposase
MTTKILALTDALGNLVRFVLLPGQRFDTVGVPPLIEGLAFDALIADKAFDSNVIIAELDARGAKVVISQHPRRAKPLAIDEEMYKWRHLIENFFGKLKEFKRIAMRADKTDQSFASMIHLAAVAIQTLVRSQQFLDDALASGRPGVDRNQRRLQLASRRIEDPLLSLNHRRVLFCECEAAPLLDLGVDLRVARRRGRHIDANCSEMIGGGPVSLGRQKMDAVVPNFRIATFPSQRCPLGQQNVARRRPAHGSVLVHRKS